MSSLPSIVKSDKMLLCFEMLFEHPESDQFEEEEDIKYKVKFQMQDDKCSFLTTSTQEQVYKVINSANLTLKIDPNNIFYEVCKVQDKKKETPIVEKYFRS